MFQPVRNQRQQFCSRHFCQNVRKSQWRRIKRKDDPDYRANQKHAYQKWLKKNPGYWQQYREKHPIYTNRNREQQLQRNLHQRSTSNNNARLIAKSDALISESPVKTGVYQLVPTAESEIAKSDALIVKISLITNGYQ